MADKKKEPTSTTKVVLIVVGVVVGLSLIGVVASALFFGALFKQATDNVGLDNGQVTIQSDDGDSKTTVGEGVKLAEGFPTDVPIYGPSTLLASSKTDGKDYSAVVRTSSSTADVAGFYRTEMVANGWESQLDSDYGDGSLQTYKKGDKTASIVVTQSDDNSTDERTGFVVSVTQTQ